MLGCCHSEKTPRSVFSLGQRPHLTNRFRSVDFSWHLDVFEVNTVGGLVFHLKLLCCFWAWKLVYKAPKLLFNLHSEEKARNKLLAVFFMET